MELGTIISTLNGPSPSFFAFAIDRHTKVHKDQFVKVKTAEGIMLAMVDNIIKTNRYYSRPESVVEAENLEGLMPVSEWEFLVAEATPLGVLVDGSMHRPTLPPSPGDKVDVVEKELLFTTLGFEPTGLEVAEVFHHGVPVKLDLTKTFQKHLAILAMSGAGKSYLTSVLLEELLSRGKKVGRVATVVFDVHGEYSSFAESPPSKFIDFSKNSVCVTRMIFPVPRMSAARIASFVPGMSSVQLTELDRVIQDHYGELYDFKDLAGFVADSSIASQTKKSLKRWLLELHSTRLFGHKETFFTKRENEKEEEYILSELLSQGKLIILDLSDYITNRRKQIIVSWTASEIFKMRRADTIPPTVIILEEAHNFIPQGESRDIAMAKSIFETIAREGRKFLCSLCVVSQRPINLSTTVLSQCNTHIIMRITNPYDLDHIGKSSEGITSETLKSLTTLQVGEALVVGSAVRYPVFIKVRQRKSWEKKGVELEKEALRWEGKKAADKKELNELENAFV
ncbi:MAG: ATP-binding protein [Candidatus Altiarchaeota archaeon]|nr:ATP-binding protein [Candidatus Altiarchaeota archaeon]